MQNMRIETRILAFRKVEKHRVLTSRKMPSSRYTPLKTVGTVQKQNGTGDNQSRLLNREGAALDVFLDIKGHVLLAFA